MAKKEPERLPRPEPTPPVNNPGGGKIRVRVSGKIQYKSDDARVEIERME